MTRAGLTCQTAPRRFLRLSWGRRRALWPWLIPPLSTSLSYWPRPWPRHPGQRRIFALKDTFPTDLYMAEGLASWLGEARAELCTFPSLEALQSALDATVAVVLLSHVDFRSGERFGPPRGYRGGARSRRSRALGFGAQRRGDAPGPGELGAWTSPWAAATSFSTAAPGRRPLPTWRRRIRRPRPALAGWFGHARPFAFEPSYDPAAGVDRLKCGTPPYSPWRPLAGLLSSLRASLRQRCGKSLALTSAFMEEVAARPALKDFHCLTPGTQNGAAARSLSSIPRPMPSFRRCRTTG